MKPDKRRLLIIEAAKICFAERGFHAATMSDIALESDISVGALYRYFKSKDALITAIIQQSYQTTFTTFTQSEGNKPLAAMLSGIFANLVEDPPSRQESALVAEVLAESFRNANVDKALSVNEQEAEHWLTHKLQIARKDGQLNFECEPSSIALIIAALYDGLALRAAAGLAKNKDDLAKAISHVIKATLSVA